MLLLGNIAAFQLAWLLSVIGGAQQMPWLGPAVVVLALIFHLRAARNPFEEFALILLCAAIGTGFDSILVMTGWVTYKAGQFSEYFAPYWISTMWMLFAMTLNVSMRWLRGKPWTAVLLGMYAGPVSYVAGQAIGAVDLANQLAALTTLAVGWAVMLPVLVWCAENMDGMPGRRRSWIAEYRP